FGHFDDHARESVNGRRGVLPRAPPAVPRSNRGIVGVVRMPDKRITVWVQRFKDRPTLVLQWIDPDTGRRKSKSSGTADEKEAEQARVDLEYELNHGQYQEASRMTWERFRELFEAEYLPGCRPKTRAKFASTLNHFEAICRTGPVRSINERTLSLF